jgi:hypothetical protein
MNDKIITCHDCHGFKWKNINAYPILTICLCDSTHFLVHWIVTTPYTNGACSLAYVPLVSNKENVAPSL